MTIVRITVKALLLVAVLASPAAADEIHPVPDAAVTIGVIGTSGKIGTTPAGGWGFDLELSLGRLRTQAFVEGSLIDEKIGLEGNRISGRGARAVVGARYLARSFELGTHGAIDMHFEAFGGYAQLSLDDGPTIRRPELGVGVGYQVRGYYARGRFVGGWPRKQMGFRISARIFFSPTDQHDTEVACRGTCPGSPNFDGSGLMAVFGAQL